MSSWPDLGENGAVHLGKVVWSQALRSDLESFLGVHSFPACDHSQASLHPPLRQAWQCVVMDTLKAERYIRLGSHVGPWREASQQSTASGLSLGGQAWALAD